METPTPRLKSALWVQACVRRAAASGGIVMVLRKGDPDSGAILLQLMRADGLSVVLAETRGGDGARAWYRVSGAEPVAHDEADRLLERARQRDADAWLVEIEDRGRDLPFDEPIL